MLGLFIGPVGNKKLNHLKIGTTFTAKLMKAKEDYLGTLVFYHLLWFDVQINSKPKFILSLSLLDQT